FWRSVNLAGLQARKHDAALRLIFALFVLVADFAVFVGLEENDLAQAFIGVDLRGQRSGVADFERDKSFPLRLERRDVDDDAATGISRFADADRQDVARNAEVFDRTSESKGIRRDNADFPFVVN